MLEIVRVIVCLLGWLTVCLVRSAPFKHVARIAMHPCPSHQTLHVFACVFVQGLYQDALLANAAVKERKKYMTQLRATTNKYVAALFKKQQCEGVCSTNNRAHYSTPPLTVAQARAHYGLDA